MESARHDDIELGRLSTLTAHDVPVVHCCILHYLKIHQHRQKWAGDRGVTITSQTARRLWQGSSATPPHGSQQGSAACVPTSHTHNTLPYLRQSILQVHGQGTHKVQDAQELPNDSETVHTPCPHKGINQYRNAGVASQNNSRYTFGRAYRISSGVRSSGCTRRARCTGEGS